MKNKGSAQIEALLCFIPTFFAIGLLGITHLGFFIKTWITSRAHETTICIMSYGYEKSECEAKFRKEASILWPKGNLEFVIEKKTAPYLFTANMSF